MGKNEQALPEVCFFYRKPRKVGNYSVEFIFKDVSQRLRDRIRMKDCYMPYESSGIFKRIYNCIQSAFKQSDVNHITGDINYIGIFLAKRKTIQTILDCVHLSTSTGLKHYILKLFWVTIPVNRARFVTAISTSTKKEILKYVDCNPEKIIVIPVAISDRYQRFEKVFNAERPRILQLGTAPNKNIPRLIQALESVSCTLDVVGKHDPALEALLKKSGIDYTYSWGLSDEDILEKYKMADIISLASTYEGFGMPILEGQAVGRPVLTSNIFSMPEVAGDSACIVDPYNVGSIREGLLKIIRDETYREGLVCRGFENIKRFNPDKIALQYFDLYNKIASN